MPANRYVPRGRNALHTIFERHFADFCEQYDEKYAPTYGMYRLERIQQLGERFSTCGDYLQGVARICCTNPECGHDYFRPFSCKGFYLCPSCSRKRTILFAEHLTNEVLLRLPHRQFVFTVPKALRPFFRHDRRLFAEVSRLIYDILRDFYHEAAGRPLLTGMVIAHQTFGDMLRWNPHFHAIVLEGGFDDEGTFFFIPFSGLQSMVEIFRRRVIKLLVERELLNEDFARNLLCWKHSGFSIDNSVRILDESSQESLAEYIARPPISLKKIRYEPFKGKVLFHTKYSEYFKQNVHLFDALDFLAELTQHIPPKGLQLIRRYGLYASRTKGRWHEMPWVAERAPQGWKTAHRRGAAADDLGYEPLPDGEEEVTGDARKRAWARLLAKVYEVDPFVCPKCGAEMKVIAVIEDPDELKRILRHLIKMGRSPPGFDPDRLN
ncbi:MAG: transposase [Planctomycetes bacterium]|nr:transposase [Planctomycetota bacterium]